MTREQILTRVSIDPAVCFGKPVIKGTRIWVSLILENLAEGISNSDLIKEYPQLKQEDILAALAYGAAVSSERVIPVPLQAA